MNEGVKMSLLDKTNKCKRINKCNAPLCPSDKECLKHCIWYPDYDLRMLGGI